MIYNTVPIEYLYRRIELVCNFDDDNEMDNVYEFIGWGIRDIGCYFSMDSVNKEITVENHRAPLPCDFFSLNQICYNGWPLTYSGRTYGYEYLLCNDCFPGGGNVINTTTVRRNTRLSTFLADYKSTDGVQRVSIGQIVKVDSSHTAGGEPGHYYERLNTDTYEDLSLVDYSGVDWKDVSDDASKLNNGLLFYEGNGPYEHYYYINPGYIITSFSEGTINVSYNAIPTDNNGYYKIPDDEEYLMALEYYVKMRLAQRGYKFPEEPLEVLKYEWRHHRDMARSNAEWFNIDQMDAFTKRWMRPISVLDRAQNFFKPEW